MNVLLKQDEKQSSGLVKPSTLDHFRSSPSNTPTITQPPSLPIKKTLTDFQLTDDFEPFEFDWLIEDIFDKGRLHMICGPQGSGKTRFLLRLIHDWSQGIPVLGHASNPAKFVYIDAARDRKSIKVALRSLGINPSDFFLIDWNEMTNATFNDLLNKIPEETEVIFIDNLAMMLQSENHSDPSSSYTTVFKFLSKLKNWMIKNNKTIIFTHTFIKSEVGHKYSSPRSKVYGAQAWLQSCETAIMFDEENPQDLRDPYRVLDILVKNYQPKDHIRRYKMQDDGRLVSAPKLPPQVGDKPLLSEEEKETPEHILLLSYFPTSEPISANDLAKKTALPVSTLYRHLTKLQQLSLIEKKNKTYSRL